MLAGASYCGGVVHANSWDGVSAGKPYAIRPERLTFSPRLFEEHEHRRASACRGALRTERRLRRWRTRRGPMGWRCGAGKIKSTWGTAASRLTMPRSFKILHGIFQPLPELSPSLWICHGDERSARAASAALSAAGLSDSL